MEERQKAIETHIKKDTFANHLGAKLEALEPGYSRFSLTVTPDMLNFHGTTHGGLLFSLGDIAFAAAGNSRGQTAVALNVNISFLKATAVGSKLVAEAKEQQLDGPTGIYDITVWEEPSGQLVAKSQAMIYRKREFFVPQNEQLD